MTASHIIALGSAIATATMLGAVEWQSRQSVVSAGFWFDDEMTFELPHLARVGGPLSAEEQGRIRATARDEVVAAFAGFRVAVSDRRDAFYRVRVVKILAFRRTAVSGQSNVFGPLGGAGAVSFETLASQAIARAPAGADRSTIVDAIGCGLGRAAVHEFTHQLLPHVAIHATTDERSYEYWNSNRTAQYYGAIRWDVAQPYLQRRLGR